MEFRCIQTNNENLPIRRQTLNGKKHIVAPVVMIREGVMCGSGGCAMYTAEELSKFAQAWNGRPVTIGHPMHEEQPCSANDTPNRTAAHIGSIYNTVFQDGKLKAEIWLDESAAKSRWPNIVNGLQSQLQVSTGLFADSQYQPGTFNGKEYQFIAQNIRPDHLALVERGACSWQDGCGVRANQGGNMKKHPARVFTNQAEYKKIVDMLRRRIDSMDNSLETHYLEAVYDEFLIYKVSSRNGREKLYRRNYSISEGIVSLGEQIVEVTEKREFVPVQNNQQTIGAMKMQEEKGIGFPTVGGEWHDPNKQQKQQPQQQQPGPQQPQQQPSNRPQANTQQGESPLGVNGNDGQYHTDPTTTYKLRGVSNG